MSVVAGVDTETVEEEEKEPGCSYYFMVMDDLVLRPLLVHNYKHVRYTPEIEFHEVFNE